MKKRKQASGWVWGAMGILAGGAWYVWSTLRRGQGSIPVTVKVASPEASLKEVEELPHSPALHSPMGEQEVLRPDYLDQAQFSTG